MPDRACTRASLIPLDCLQMRCISRLCAGAAVAAPVYAGSWEVSNFHASLFRRHQAFGALPVLRGLPGCAPPPCTMPCLAYWWGAAVLAVRRKRRSFVHFGHRYCFSAVVVAFGLRLVSRAEDVQAGTYVALFMVIFLPSPMARSAFGPAVVAMLVFRWLAITG